MIRNLQNERDLVNEVIAALERLDNRIGSGVKRRGRRFMDNDGRKEVSERMKRYWAARRKQSGAGTKERGNGSKRRGAFDSNSRPKRPDAPSAPGVQMVAA